MFSGNTKLLGIMGHPIKHSFSPAIQNAAIEDAKLDYAYLPLEVPAESLNHTLKWIRTLNFRGFNVTIPHKNRIIPLLDEVTELAKTVGAVNTVLNNHGKLTGYNTDIVGFVKGLEEANFKAENKNAVILGAGGATRAVIAGLKEEKIGNLTVVARNIEKAKELAGNAINFTDEEYKAALQNADIVINTTSLGMYPNVDDMPPIDFSVVKDTALIYDVIYTPAETKFLKEAKLRNLKIQNGETMLVEQGAAAFRLWTEEEPNVELMKKTLREQLKNTNHGGVE